MYPIPSTETLMETRTCRHCLISFPITDKDMEFYEKVSPVFNGKKYSIPTPTLCPDCRQQRRLSFRNERKLYKRKCDATGRDIISIYSPDKPFKVYHQDFWWSDKWDPMEYGRDFDFSRGFFEQFEQFMRKVPNIHTLVINSENCDYINWASYCKDCYLSFKMDYCEDCYYIGDGKYVRNSIDCLWTSNSERCYECIDCDGCHNLLYSIRSSDCSDSFLLSDCTGCKNCIGCFNLINKEYYIFNEPSTKEEFDEAKKHLGTMEGVQKSKSDFHKADLDFPKKYYYGHSNADFSGDGIRNLKNSFRCFDSFDLENCKHCNYVFNAKNCMDYDIFGDNSELIYECQWTGINAFNNLFCNFCWNGGRQNMYCFFVTACQNCFGCMSIKNKQYCIFNKQYTKEEYKEIVPRIIKHMEENWEWGEYFPSTLSPFGYNEASTDEFYPLTREEALSQWFNWSDYEVPFPRVEKIIPASKLPDDITKIPDDILNWAIECEVTKKPFRIIKQELEFYRKHNLPIPRRHPDQRHLDRMALRNPRKLFERKCDKCGVEMVTTYSSERKEKVYCEGCYEKEVVG